MSNLIHECHRNIIRALRSYLSKCQYIIYTLNQKLSIWHSFPLPTWPSLQQRKLKDRKVIFPYFACVVVDLVPEQIVLSIRKGKESQGPAPPELLMLSRCRHRAHGFLTTGKSGKRSLGCLTHPVQSLQQRCGASSAFRSAAKSTIWVNKLPECLHCPGKQRAHLKTDSTWIWAVIY